MKNITVLIFSVIFSVLHISAQKKIAPENKSSGKNIKKSVINKSAKYFSVTHSASFDIENDNTPLCGLGGQYHYENSYYLVYDLKNDFNINGDWIIQRVDVAIEYASAGNGYDQPLEIKLWVMSEYDHTQIITEDLTLLVSDTFQVLDTESGTLKTTDFSPGYTVAEDKVLVVEFLLPDGQENENLLYLGSNDSRISDSTYIRAPHCYIYEPANVSEILSSDCMIIARIYGEYASPDPQIQSFTIPGQIANTEILNEPDYTVKVVMPADTSLEALAPVIQIPAGFRITPESGDTVDFSQGSVTYTVDNNFSKVSQSWEVSAINAGPDIIGAGISGQNGDVSVSGEPDYTVTIPVVEGTDLTALAPSIYVYEGFTVNPESGSVQDFSSGPVTYTVSHETLPLSRNWSVSVIETEEIAEVKDIKNSRITIFPNPADEYIFAKGSNIIKMTLFDAAGKIISEEQGEKLCTQNIPEGFYFLEITGYEYSAVKKVIIKH
ncbi:MAG: T9SS type A sorting domain-containing protein [Chlorobi bacterium]|nr:T9SS type A sorting domain-containing protein [Chlorobiota bacterium]